MPSKKWSPSPGLGGPPRGMLSNRPRIQMGFLPALFAAAEPVLPWIIGIIGVGGAAIGVSALARNEAEQWKGATGLNLSNVPIAVLSGGTGAIAFVISGNLEGTGKVIATSVGVAGVAGALLALFTGQPKPPVPPGPGEAPKTPLSVPPASVPAGQQAPNIAPGPLSRAFTVSFPPSQPNTGGTVRNVLRDQDWEFVVRNETGTPVSFYTGVAIYDEGSNLVWKSPAVDPVYGRKLMTVPPGQSVSGSQKSQNYGVTLLGKSLAVEIDLFRNRDDSTPFLTSEAIPITMSIFG